MANPNPLDVLANVDFVMDNIRLGLFAMRKTYPHGTALSPEGCTTDAALENFLLQRGVEFGLEIDDIDRFRQILEEVDGFTRQNWQVHRYVQPDTGMGMLWLEDADARDPWVIENPMAPLAPGTVILDY